MVTNLSVLIPIAGICIAAAFIGLMVWNWSKQTGNYTDDGAAPTQPPPKEAVAERKYIGKRYTGPVLTQETVLEYIIEFRLADGTLHTAPVPYSVWLRVELGKPAGLLLQNDAFLDFDNLA